MVVFIPSLGSAAKAVIGHLLCIRDAANPLFPSLLSSSHLNLTAQLWRDDSFFFFLNFMAAPTGSSLARD